MTISDRYDESFAPEERKPSRDVVCPRCLSGQVVAQGADVATCARCGHSWTAREAAYAA